MKLLPLNRGKNDNIFCGPAAVSFITGENTSDIARIMRKRNKRRAIKGTYPADLKYAFSYYGYRMHTVQDYMKSMGKNKKEYETLNQWLTRTRESRTEEEVWLLIAGRHWQLIHQDKYACGIHGIVNITDERIAKRARVTGIYKITAKKWKILPKTLLTLLHP